MSKFKIVSKLADELGTTTSKASRFVDDVGADNAQKVIDDIGDGGKATADWLTPKKVGAAVGAGAIGGGALAWRQQDVAQAKNLAEQAESYEQSIKSIMDSNLPPEMKKKLVENAGENTGNDGGNGNDDEKSWWEKIIPEGNDPMSMVLMVVIVAIVLRTVLEGDE